MASDMVVINAVYTELHREQRAIGFGLDQHVGLGVLDAALAPPIAVHLVVNPPEDDRLLALVTKTGLLFRPRTAPTSRYKSGWKPRLCRPVSTSKK